jgi:hypothetical protein
MKDTASSLVTEAKEGVESMMDTLTDKMHTAEDKASSAYHDIKKDLQQPSSQTPPRTTAAPEPTDTHPLAASMRDTHLHPGPVSIPTHANQTYAPPSSTSISASHQAALEAAAQTEPKDPTAAGGIRGALSSIHQKLEEGAEVIKDKVDEFAEKHLRSERTSGDHLSQAHEKDLPTLVDSSNERNTAYVRAKMHPSDERAGVMSASREKEVARSDDSI